MHDQFSYSRNQSNVLICGVEEVDVHNLASVAGDTFSAMRSEKQLATRRGGGGGI